jgi:hypothetical protein
VLFSGTPIVTLEGETYPSRVAGCLLKTVGLSEYVAKTDDEFVEKTQALINLGKTEIHKMKNSIRQKVLSSSLFNTYIYSEYFYQMLKKSWVNYINNNNSAIYLDYINEYNNYEYKVVDDKAFNIKFNHKEISITKLKLGDNEFIFSAVENLMFINNKPHNNLPIIDTNFIIEFKYVSVQVEKDNLAEDTSNLSVIEMMNNNYETVYEWHGYLLLSEGSYEFKIDNNIIDNGIIKYSINKPITNNESDNYNIMFYQ